MIPPRRDGTFLSRLDGKLAKAGWRVYTRQLMPGSRLGGMEAGSYNHSIEFILQAGSRQLSRPA